MLVSQAHRDKLDGAMLAEINSQSGDAILKKWKELSAQQQQKCIGLKRLVSAASSLQRRTPRC